MKRLLVHKQNSPDGDLKMTLNTLRLVSFGTVFVPSEFQHTVLRYVHHVSSRVLSTSDFTFMTECPVGLLQDQCQSPRLIADRHVDLAHAPCAQYSSPGSVSMWYQGTYGLTCAKASTGTMANRISKM